MIQLIERSFLGIHEVKIVSEAKNQLNSTLVKSSKLIFKFLHAFVIESKFLDFKNKTTVNLTLLLRLFKVVL